LPNKTPFAHFEKVKDPGTRAFSRLKLPKVRPNIDLRKRLHRTPILDSFMLIPSVKQGWRAKVRAYSLPGAQPLGARQLLVDTTNT